MAYTPTLEDTPGLNAGSSYTPTLDDTPEVKNPYAPQQFNPSFLQKLAPNLLAGGLTVGQDLLNALQTGLSYVTPSALGDYLSPPGS